MTDPNSPDYPSPITEALALLYLAQAADLDILTGRPVLDAVEENANAINAAVEVLRAAPEPEYEYWWKSDIWSPHAYETKEMAEEYYGAPKRFRRIKAGPWEEVE